MIRSVLTYCALLSFSLAHGQSSEFFGANASYESGNFKEAEEMYGKLISEGHQSSELYYNLGNSYYQQSEIGKAVWSYEKALKIDPSNEDAQFNLDFVRMLTVDRIDNERPGISTWFKRLFYGPNINLWPYLSLIFSIIVALMLIVFFKTEKRKWKNRSMLLGGFCGLGLLLSLFVSHYHLSFIQDRSKGIIIVSEVQIKLSPFEEASSSFSLHEGSKVKLVGTNDDWVEIEVNGNSGWMLKEDLWEI